MEKPQVPRHCVDLVAVERRRLLRLAEVADEVERKTAWITIAVR